MKILLFDDDKSTVDMLLNTIPWDTLGIDSFAPVYSVEQAKAAFLESTVPIDLMICDIEAPGGTGLDLLRWVREQNYPTENIFLTNHEKFSFASEAMRLDSVEYILKMSPQSDVVAALRRALVRVQRRNMLHNYSDAVTLRASEQFWSDILAREQLPKSVSAEAESRGIPLETSYGPVLCVCMTSEHTGIIEHTLRDIIFEKDAPWYVPGIAVIRLPFNSTFLLLPAADAFSAEALEPMALSLQARLGAARCICYVASAVSPDIVPATVRRLAAAARSDVNHDGAVIFCGDQSDSISTEILPVPVEEWKSLLRQYDKGELFRLIQNHVSRLCAGGVSRDVLWQFHHDYLQMLFAALAEDHIEAHLLFHEISVIRLCDSAPDSAYNMMKWVDYSLSCAIKSMQEARNTLSLIEQVRAYIDAHYREKITRVDIAAHFYMSVDYLSHTFGKNFGMTIPEYINRQRLEYACELLASGHSVTDAALEAGFENLSYFSTLFKRQKGITPGNYRRK